MSLSYGQATSLALDPVEKKPFARFHPGSMILSYGSYGCNLRCSFCQNSDISMVDAAGSLPTYFMSPENLIERAIELRAQGLQWLTVSLAQPPEQVQGTRWMRQRRCVRRVPRHIDQRKRGVCAAGITGTVTLLQAENHSRPHLISQVIGD